MPHCTRAPEGTLCNVNVWTCAARPHIFIRASCALPPVLLHLRMESLLWSSLSLHPLPLYA